MSASTIHIAREGHELGILPVHDAVELLKAGFLLPVDQWWSDEDPVRRDLSELAPESEYAGAGWAQRAGQMAAGVNRAVRKGVTSVGDAMGRMTAKPRAATKQTTELLLCSCLPRLKGLTRQLLAQKFAVNAKSALQNKESMMKLFGAVYDCLPKPVTRFVDEPSFVAFCFARRRQLLGDTADAKPMLPNSART